MIKGILILHLDNTLSAPRPPKLVKCPEKDQLGTLQKMKQKLKGVKAYAKYGKYHNKSGNQIILSQLQKLNHCVAAGQNHLI